MAQTMKARPHLKRWLCAAMFILFGIAGVSGQGLAILSVKRGGEGLVEIAVSSLPSQRLAIDASDDLKTWVEVTNLNANGSRILRFSDAGPAARFYRVFSGNNSYFTAVVRSGTGEPVTNATVTIEATGQSYPVNGGGEVKI